MLLARRSAERELRSAREATQTEFERGRQMPTDLGITGSTFRAYRGCKSSPSKLYRHWVAKAGFSIVSGHPVASRESFLALHRKLLHSFVREWTRAGLRELSFAERHKVIDLFTKAIAFRSGHPCEEARLGFYHFASIPLDKFSLLAVGKLFYGIVVGGMPSMGNIRDLQTYDFIQGQIFSLTQAGRLPNLVFDHYAWNQAH